MSMPEAKRPLSELEVRISVIRTLNSTLQEKFVDIARTKSPSASFDLAEARARIAGFAPSEAIEVAKATRWLAVIKRDYEEDFNNVIALIENRKK